MQTLRKTTWMPYSYIGKLAISLLLLLFFSCQSNEDSPVLNTFYTYKNQSNYDIEILAYLSVDSNEQRVFLIKNEEEIVQPGMAILVISEADSVQVTFDPNGSPKIAKFINPKYLDGQASNMKYEFNILFHKKFEHYDEGNTYYHTYTFTIADYNNAK